MKIRERIDEIFEEIVEIRRTLHENPELSEQEIKTSQRISEFLTKYEIPHETEIAGHGIVAIIEGKGKIAEGQKFLTVGIRADMDALPINEEVNVPFKSKTEGVMHACGHDIHVAALLGTAKILKEAEADFSGTVKLFFEPAEETIGGAKQMIEAGYLMNPTVDAAIGLHITPEVETGMVQFRRGKMNAASTEFEITVEGVACHGAHPENGVDSIVAASSLVCMLQSIVTRNLSPTNPGIITIGQIHGGNKDNIIANETVLSGMIRALDNDTRSFLKKRVKEMAENVASGFGAKANVQFTDGYPALANDDEVEDILEAVAEEVLSKENVCFLPEPSLGADDFSYFSEAIQAVYFNIGCLGKGETVRQALHSEQLNPDEECIRTGILMEVFGALELFKQIR
ncbi:M20 metallopeptidase family protein [Aminipila luticellarii]|uniref:Amidohydrolase n=1 Tax=Aminipila luticellarii TaxID=2507160 RepID=A0A410PTY0_9FIRM|nr:M20 family metallopeptidase [Aminipila luticellarii]QAT42412.1 amidohydrolase [Aminipila luticellarii]